MPRKTRSVRRRSEGRTILSKSWLGSGDLCQELKKTPLPFGVNIPIHRRGLIAVLVVAPAGIKVSPGGMFRNRGNEIVRRFLKIKMIILVEQNGLGAIAGRRTSFAHHLGNLRRVRNA